MYRSQVMAGLQQAMQQHTSAEAACAVSRCGSLCCWGRVPLTLSCSALGALGLPCPLTATCCLRELASLMASPERRFASTSCCALHWSSFSSSYSLFFLPLGDGKQRRGVRAEWYVPLGSRDCSRALRTSITGGSAQCLAGQGRTGVLHGHSEAHA
jgi:hypothetical protein